MIPNADYPELLRESVSEARLSNNLRAVRLKQDRRRLLRVGFAASSATAVLCAMAFFIWSSPRGGVTLGAAEIESAEAQRCLEGAGSACAVDRIPFADGSQIALSSATRLALANYDAQTVHSVLHEGWARFSVRPGGQRRWLVDAGNTRVEVVGTSFTVARNGAGARVRVHHGRVLVRRADLAGGKVLLSAGERLDVEVRPAQADASGPDPVAEAEAEAEAEATKADAPRPQTRPSRTKSPRAEGAAATEAPSVLTRADALRAAGDHRGASTLLRDALVQEPRGAQRGLIAFTLAQLLLDTQEQPGEAAAALAHALAEPSLPASLREQALARNVEALARASRFDDARHARDDYLHAYPRGRWASAMLRWAPPE